MKIEKLSAEQEAKMLEVKQFWLDYIFSCKNNQVNRESAKIGIEWLYKLAGRNQPVIIYVDSPLSCQYAVAYVKAFVKQLPMIFDKAQVGAQVRAQVGARVGDQVWDQVGDQVWDQVGARVGAQVRAQVGARVGDQVWDQVGDQVWDQVGDQVRDQVGDQVGAQVWDQVRDQVWDQVRDQVWDQVRAQVGDQVWDQVRAQVGDQVRARVGDQVWDQVGDQVRDQVGDQVGARVGDQVRDQVGDQVGDQVWDQVGARVGAQVRDQVRDQVGEYQSFAYYGSLTDYYWLSFYDFFTQIGVINHKGFQEFKTLMLSGIYDMIQLNGFCIISSLPKYIARDNQNRLHDEKVPAIQFNDGYELCYWHGVSVPKEWITNQDCITKETIANEKNAEQRRCIREIIGTKKYADLLDIEEIDRDHVNGQDVVLYRTVRPDDLIDKHIFYVKVTCHSTNREYFLCIPPEAAKNAWGAVAWTFGKEATEYAPILES